MKVAFAVILLCFLCGSESALNYPLILLCTTNTSFPLANCQFRNNRDGGFESCGAYSNVTVTIIDYTQEHYEQCTVFNIDNVAYASDAYSIVTFTTNEGEGLLVDHVALVDPALGIPQTLDSFTDLIYVYQSSALVTITGQTNEMYSSNLHTHFRPNPPEYIWVKFDPIVFA